jgi:hypothetical protein
MNNDDFNTKEEELLQGFHPVLASTLRMQAYDRGHSSGNSEVIAILEGLVHDFRQVNSLLIKESK